MSINSSTTGKRPPDVFKSRLYMLARVFNSLWNVVDGIENDRSYRQEIDREAVRWYNKTHVKYEIDREAENW